MRATSRPAAAKWSPSCDAPLVSALLLLWGLLAALTPSAAILFNPEATPTAGLGANLTGSTTPATPYWRRPGCHRVGHTRTISIPGCVKFNISTNACRGFCMSYSVPANEDLGPTAQAEPDAELARANQKPNAESPKSSSFDVGGRRRRALGWFQSGAGADEQEYGLPKRPNAETRNSRPHASQPTSATQLGVGLGDSSDGKRRDVVSVSQCCGMMDTEDVVVNLRCGASEVRRLVFKSAKSCECFFCKHV